MEQSNSTTVWIKVGEQGRIPVYATDGSAGCDLIAPRDIVLRPGQKTVLGLDLTLAIPPGVEAQIRPRSGLSLKTSLRLPNAPGTIDSDYRSELGVILHNTFSSASLVDLIAADHDILKDLDDNYRRMSLADFLCLDGRDQEAKQLIDSAPKLAGETIFVDRHDNPYGTLYIRSGDRVAQMVFARCLQAEYKLCDQPELIGTNRGGGFGSTGGSGHL